jgi:hypothetical protein
MLSDLALAVKGSWGYDQAFIESCRDKLAFGPDDIGRRHFVVADLGGLVAGCYSVDGDPPVGELGNMWIRPSKIGTGLGRVLWQDATATHRRPGASGSCVLPTSHARSDAGHRCPVELTVAARGLRTRLLESCLACRHTSLLDLLRTARRLGVGVRACAREPMFFLASAADRPASYAHLV